jgi:hypothetical protein
MRILQPIAGGIVLYRGWAFCDEDTSDFKRALEEHTGKENFPVITRGKYTFYVCPSDDRLKECVTMLEEDWRSDDE